MRAANKSDSVDQFVWIDYRADLTTDKTNPVFEWKTSDGVHKAGYTCAIPANSTGIQVRKKHYVVTGNYNQLLSIARLWTGEEDQSSAVLCGQAAAHVPCHAEYVADVFALHEKINPVLRKTMRDAVDYIGVSLCYEHVSFVSDPPVGHHVISTSDIEAAWSDSHAARLGMVQQPDGTWSDGTS